ncbi:MAG TPA: SHOCT domain-containing protein [Candidatus Limnocylindria bacterium]|nr:SHOCT domain-containing protein [Candidatus Limnocylindria bacterium]
MMFLPFHWIYILGMGFVVLVGIAIAIAIVQAVTRPHQQTYPPGPMPPTGPSETPLDILARRFAKGEITAEEYQKGRDLLGGGGPSS